MWVWNPQRFRIYRLMAVILKNGAVFLHTPKTGGSWVVHVLRALNLVDVELEDGHADYERTVWNGNFARNSRVAKNLLKRALGNRVVARRPQCGAKIFCFVRDPLNWLESIWRFKCARHWEDWGEENQPARWHCACWLNGLGSPDFNEFIQRVNRKRPGFVTELFGRFARPEVALIGKQENLPKELTRALRCIGVEFDERFVNTFSASE
jgi:hypothetical protein